MEGFSGLLHVGAILDAKGGGLFIPIYGLYVGALIIRIGFWGPLYYSYNKEPSQQY